MTIIRFLLPTNDHTLKKLLLIFWEIVPKTTGDGKLLQEMILVCDAYRKVCTYACACVRAYIHVCDCGYVSLYICIHPCMYVHKCMHSCMCVSCVHVCTVCHTIRFVFYNFRSM